jgi:chorismate mutase
MNDLEIFRTELDETDKNLIDYFSMRFKLIEKIGKYKKKNNITLLQPERWQQVLDSRKAY